MRRAALLACLSACGGDHDMNDPKYPQAACSDLHAASRDAASYAEGGDWRASLFADERDVWPSTRCDSLRATLPPLDDRHDLEEQTLRTECDSGSSRVDPSARLACRAGCFAERRHAALVVAWGRAIRGVAAFDPKRVELERLVKDCPALQTVQTVTGSEDDRYRALWRCAHLPLPPKSFRLSEQDRVAYVRNGAVTSTRRVGLEWTMVSHRDGGRVQTVMFEECGGVGRRWDVFYSESP